MRVRPASPIPLFDRKPVNPFAPIGNSAAVARSVGQGRPQAGARALPSTEASTMARSRPVGGGGCARGLITAIVLAMTCGSISAVFAASGERQSVPMAATNSYAGYIAEASRRFGIPESWIRAVMHVESGGDQHATSPRGAMGLMQLMPATWVELSVRYGLGVDPFDARDNIIAGTVYLKDMHDRFGSAGFLAAYHAGPSRYEQHLATGRPLPQETTAYVAAVTPLLGDRQSERTAIRIRRVVPWREAPLFVERAGAP